MDKKRKGGTLRDPAVSKEVRDIEDGLPLVLGYWEMVAKELEQLKVVDVE